jgi:hypothetical protein
MKSLQNPYIYATVSAIVGAITYLILKYFLLKQFDILSTVLIGIFLFIGAFIGQKYLANKLCN